MPGFCCPFSLFCRFGDLQVFVAAFYRRSCFERPGPPGRFLAEILIRHSIFPSNAKKDSLLVPFSSPLGKIFKLSAPIRTIVASLLELSTQFPTELVTIRQTTAQLEINISDPATAWQMRLTRRVHSQKISVEIQPCSSTVHRSGESHLRTIWWTCAAHLIAGEP